MNYDNNEKYFDLFDDNEEFVLNNCDNKIINDVNNKDIYNHKINKLIPIENHETGNSLEYISNSFSRSENDNNINNQKENELNPIYFYKSINNQNCIKKKLRNNFFGRKRKNSNEIGKHNKYSQDNIIRKIKTILLSILSSFINSFIYKIYDGNIGKGVFIKELKKLNQRQIIDSKNNKLFLKKTLQDIFSDDISRKFTNYLPKHNKNVINNLINDEDPNKRRSFQHLFSLTFLECLMHFRRSKDIPQLRGLKLFNDIRKDYEDDLEYVNLLDYYIFNFEEIIMRKRQRI